MTTQTESPRIYVACLAAYNNGILHGVWIDATDDDIHEQIQAMLAASPMPEHCEEYAIHDYSGFYGMHLSEYEDLARVHDLAVLIEKHGEAFAKYCDNMGDDADEDSFEEAFQGHWDSELAFTENLIDDLGLLHDVPEILQRYFDTESYARDLFLGGDYYSIESSEGGIFVYSNC